MPANFAFIAPLNKYTARKMDIENLTVGISPDQFALPTTDGSANQVLTTNGSGVVTWAAGASGTGDVDGPASAINNNMVVFDGATGKLIKDSGIPVAYGTGLSSKFVLGDGATGGTDNLYVGVGLSPVATGASNLVVGISSASSMISTSNFNTIVGSSSGSSLGDGAVNNTILGYSAGNALAFGTTNTLVGSFANTGVSTANAIALGYQCLNNEDNTACINAGFNFRSLNDNYSDLGTTARRWKDIYSSGTQYLATGTSLTKLDEFNFATEGVGDFRLPEQMTVIGNVLFFYAIANSTQDGIISVDISRPENLKVLDTFYNGQTSFNYAIIGKYGYLKGATNAIDVVDISRPDNLTEVVASYAMGVSTDRVFGKNNKLYLATGTTVRVYSIQNPLAPVLEATVSSASAYVDVDTNDTYLYGANSDGSIDIIDLTTNTVINNGYSVFTSGVVGNVILQGTLLYCLSTSSTVGGMQIVDVGNPLSPTKLGLVSFNGNDVNQASHLSVQGDYIYAHRTGTSNIYVIDATDKASLISTVVPISLTAGLVGAIYVSGDVLYALTTNATNVMSLGSFRLNNTKTRACNIGSITGGSMNILRNATVEGEIIGGKGITCNDGINIGDDSIISGHLGIANDLNVGGHLTIGESLNVGGNVWLNTAKTIYFDTAANSTFGTGTLVAGGVVVNNTMVTPTSKIIVQRKEHNGSTGIGALEVISIISGSFIVQARAILGAIQTSDYSSFDYFVFGT